MKLAEHLASKRAVRIRVERDLGRDVTQAHEHSESWHPYYEGWANVRQLAARETQYANVTYALATHLVTLRGDNKTTGITPAMRVIVLPSSRTLYVYGVEDVEHRGREVRLWCGETVQT